MASAAPSDNPFYKCGRCHHLFRQFPGAPAAPVARPENGRTRAARPSEPEPDNLEFIFPDRDGALADEADEGWRDGAERTASDRRRDDTAEDTPDDADGSWREEIALDFDEPVIDAAPPHTEARDGEAEDTWNDGVAVAPATGAEDGPGRVLRLEEDDMRVSAYATINRALLTLVAVHAALALVIRLAPETSERWLARVPVLGRGLAGDHVLARHVQLRNVQGVYQRLRNQRRIFVISGEAVNNSATAVEQIEVQGTLYGPQGELDHKIVSTGNRTTLTELSESEIAFLQRLEPRTTLPPGKSTSFVIVFLEPPRDLVEFSSRVLTARPTRQAGTRPAPRPDRPPASLG